MTWSDHGAVARKLNAFVQEAGLKGVSEKADVEWSVLYR
jgi:hypothetical protein